MFCSSFPDVMLLERISELKVIARSLILCIFLQCGQYVHQYAVSHISLIYTHDNLIHSWVPSLKYLLELGNC